MNNTINLNSDLNIKINGNGNKIFIGTNVKIPFRITIGNNSELHIGNNVEIQSRWIGFINESILYIEDGVKFGSSANIWPVMKSRISIGKDTTFGNNSMLRAHTKCNIDIGEKCLFSWDTRLISGDGHAIFDINSREMINNPCGNNLDIMIGSHVWSGGNVFFYLLLVLEMIAYVDIDH